MAINCQLWQLFAYNPNSFLFKKYTKMAQIREHIRKNGKKSFFVRIRLKGSPDQTASFERLTDAKIWIQQTEAAIREGRYSATARSKKHTFSDLVDRFIENTIHLKVKNERYYKTQLGWWRDKIGNILLAEITPALIIEYRDMLAQTKTVRGAKKSNATVNRYMAALSSAISTAVKEWGWMEDNPVRKVSKLKEPRGRVRYLSDEERGRFLDACKESHNLDLYTAVILSMSTGGRQNEIWGLRWSNVDLKNGFVTFEDTKNNEPRSVPIQGLALELIEERSNKTSGGLVFPSMTDPKRHFDFRRPFQMALKAAQIEDFRWHDLRHCTASYLVMSGVDMRTVAEILGHKNLQMTQRYSHLSPAHLKDAVAKMNNKFLVDS